jgi:hypothetical protein
LTFPANPFASTLLENAALKVFRGHLLEQVRVRSRIYSLLILFFSHVINIFQAQIAVSEARHASEVDRALRMPTQDVAEGIAEAQAEFSGNCHSFITFLPKKYSDSFKIPKLLSTEKLQHAFFWTFLAILEYWYSHSFIFENEAA